MRLRAGGGIQAAPDRLVASVGPDGTVETGAGLRHASARAIARLRARLAALEGVGQASLDAEIASSHIPVPPMRNDSPLYGLEFPNAAGRLVKLMLRSPHTYRGAKLAGVDKFIAVLDATAAVAGVHLPP